MFPRQGLRVWSLVGELRSHTFHGTDKKLKQFKKKKIPLLPYFIILKNIFFLPQGCSSEFSVPSGVGPSPTCAVLPWNFPNQRWTYYFFISAAKLQAWPSSCCGHICGHMTGLRDETNKGARSRRERQTEEEERDLDTDKPETSPNLSFPITWFSKTIYTFSP